MKKSVKRLIRFLLLLILFGAVGIACFAQESSEDAKTEKNFRSSPLVIPAYTPEGGYLLPVGDYSASRRILKTRG